MGSGRTAPTLSALVVGITIKSTGKVKIAMPFYERANVRIHYQETGSGFPLLIIPGGGLNSTISWVATGAPFNAIEEFSGKYRCITADLRNAYDGQSSGPLEVDRPWDAHTDDQLGFLAGLNNCVITSLRRDDIGRAKERSWARVSWHPYDSIPSA